MALRGRMRLDRFLPGLLSRVDIRLHVAELGASNGDVFLQFFQLRLLGAGRRLDVRRRVAVLDRLAALGDVVEVSEELIELFLADWIVLVAVAAGASSSQAEPDGGRGIDAIDDVFDGEFFGDDAPLGVAAMVAIEAGSDVLFPRGVRQHVAGDLLDGEAIERYVAVKGVDHPVAPAPHDAFAVVLVAVGVGVAGAVEPALSHAFAIAR